MSDAPSWADEARRLIDGGMSIIDACRAVGKSEHAVRYELNINGRREKYARWNAARRSPEKKRERPVLGSYRPERAARPLTLPKISIQSQPDEDKREIRIAPRTRASEPSAGADRIREIHRRMIREGRIREPGLFDQLH